MANAAKPFLVTDNGSSFIARWCPAQFRERYDNRPFRWALLPKGGRGPVTPWDVYVDSVKAGIPKWQAWGKGAKAKLDQILAA